MKSRSAAGEQYEGDALPELPPAPHGGTHAPGAEELFYDQAAPKALDPAQYHEHPTVEPLRTGETPVAPARLPAELEAFAALLAAETARYLAPREAAHPAASSREVAARRVITGAVALAANTPTQLIGADPTRRRITLAASAAVFIAATQAEAQAGVGFPLVAATPPLTIGSSAELWVSCTAPASVSYLVETEALEQASNVAGPNR